MRLIYRGKVFLLFHKQPYLNNLCVREIEKKRPLILA